MKPRLRRLDSIINGLIEKLDGPEYDDIQVTKDLVTIINALSKDTFELIRKYIVRLASNSNVVFEGKLSKERTAEIIHGIAYWNYMINTFAMSMASSEQFKRQVWDRLENISGLERNDAISIADKWQDDEFDESTRRGFPR